MISKNDLMRLVATLLTASDKFFHNESPFLNQFTDEELGMACTHSSIHILALLIGLDHETGKQSIEGLGFYITKRPSDKPIPLKTIRNAVLHGNYGWKGRGAFFKDRHSNEEDFHTEIEHPDLHNLMLEIVKRITKK